MECICLMKNSAQEKIAPHLHQIHCHAFKSEVPLRTIEQRIMGHLTDEEYKALRRSLSLINEGADAGQLAQSILDLPQSLKDWIGYAENS